LTQDDIALEVQDLLAQIRALWKQEEPIRARLKVLRESCRTLGHQPKVRTKTDWQLILDCRICEDCISNRAGYGQWEQMTDDQVIAEWLEERRRFH
jgi:hypothetical protein